MPFKIWHINTHFEKVNVFFAQQETILGFRFYLNCNLFMSHFPTLNMGYFLNGNYQICRFLILCTLFLLQKSCLADQLHSLHFWRTFFSVNKVLKHVFANFLQIMTNLQKTVATIFYYGSPGCMLFKKVWHVLDEWFEALKTYCCKIFAVGIECFFYYELGYMSGKFFVRGEWPTMS